MGLTPISNGSSSGGGGGGTVGGGSTLYQHYIEIGFNYPSFWEAYNTETDWNIQGKEILQATLYILAGEADVYFEVRTWDLNKIYIPLTVPYAVVAKQTLLVANNESAFVDLRNLRRFSLHLQGRGFYMIYMTLTDPNIIPY